MSVQYSASEPNIYGVTDTPTSSVLSVIPSKDSTEDEIEAYQADPLVVSLTLYNGVTLRFTLGPVFKCTGEVIADTLAVLQIDDIKKTRITGFKLGSSMVSVLNFKGDHLIDIPLIHLQQGNIVIFEKMIEAPVESISFRRMDELFTEA